MSYSRIHPSVVPLTGGVNFRDQGGYRVSDGRRIKHGLLLRSGALDALTTEDCRYLEERNIVHIIDYRDPDEVEHKPDTLWQNAQYKNIPANPMTTEVNANFEALSAKTLEKFNAEQFMLGLYRELPFNNAAYRHLVSVLLEPQSQGLIQHCAIGKDRTGVGSALILIILGADEETIMEDYLLTDKTLAPYKEQMLAQLAKTMEARFLPLFEYVMSAREEFLAMALTQIKQRYHNFDHWLEAEFALTQPQREAIRHKYLEG